MKKLIAISPSNLGNETVQTVNAREMWKFLESKQEFANWIKSRIEQYDCVQGIDYIVDKKINGAGQTIQTDYFITLDIAKEFAMVERNARGKEMRQYFIECERKVKSGIPSISDPQIAAMVLMLTQHDAMKQELAKQSLELKMHVAALDIHSERLDDIESATSAVLDGHGFYSILGYCKRKGIKLDAKESARYGKLATAESKAQGVMMGSVPDGRYGSVKTYSEDILDVVFG